MTTLDDFTADFTDDPGYFDFARVGPMGSAVLEEQRALSEILARARFGSLAVLESADSRMRESVAALTGFRSDQVVFQPNTSTGLMHAMFGLTGGALMSGAEYPSVTFAAARAAEALHVLSPTHLDTSADYGRVTPGNIRDQLDASCAAVAVSLVDFRTGYLVDLDGIRQVIGDRLLIVDAVQGFGIVDAPWELCDVIVSGGQKWIRAGWGTGFMALSDRAVEHLVPVFSGFTATDAANTPEGMPLDEILPPMVGAGAFSINYPDPIAVARFAMAVERILDVGVHIVHERVAQRISEIIDLADEFAIPVCSSRAGHERAGIVVLEPSADQLTTLTASLFNHGITATIRQQKVRLSAHVSTADDSLAQLRDALMGFASAI